MKRLLFIRTNSINPDPRVEKEVNSLLLNKCYEIDIHAWDRGANYRCREELIKLKNGTAKIFRVGIRGNWGKGMKKNIIPALRYEISLYRWLSKNIKKYDVIHACDLTTGYVALRIAKKYKKKIVYDCCDYYADSQHGPKFVLNLLKKMETKVINRADATILCSEKRIRQIEPASPRKIVYIHNSPDNNLYKIASDINIFCKNSKKFKMAYVGNFCEDRWLIPFLSNIKDMDGVELHIGGFGGLEKEIKRIAKSSENIYFYGKMNYEKALRLESQCDCIVAFYETTIRNHIYAAPNKFYEALMIGVPLIMIKGSGMSEIVERERFGVVIEPNAASLKTGIRKLREFKDNKESIKKRMNDYYLKEYDWAIMEKRLIELYKEMA